MEFLPHVEAETQRELKDEIQREKGVGGGGMTMPTYETMLGWGETECAVCAAKPGIAKLCVSCMDNRDKIRSLQAYARVLLERTEFIRGREKPTAGPGADYGDQVLHQLWSLAAGREDYDKKKWIELERLVHAGIER